ncbi:MAG: TldD/PmbA family protein [Spirochaetota bacterium]|nr:TldD/PmbA family protein [Spirochaetota bacterium]
MEEKEIVTYCIDSLQKLGVQKAHCILQNREKNELNVESNNVNLLRTTYDTNLHMVAIIDQRKGSISLNKIDKESIDEAIDMVIAIAKVSEADSANDIAEKQTSKEFDLGDKNPDLDNMYDKLKEFLQYANEKYPKTILEQVILDFTKAKSYIQNSNGIDFISRRGINHFSAMFTSKDGEKTSSFNHSGFSARKLDKPIKDFGSIDRLLKQSSEQINSRSFTDKIIGDVLVTPDCLGDFISAITRNFLSDYSLITENSIYKDKLNKSIADPKLTLHSKPISEEIANGYFITGDGYEVQNSTIIEKGILKTFLLSLYGSKKTGRAKAVNDGGAYIIDPGDESLEDIINSIQKGILLCRFSGGNPSENGDFSGVVKNSYFIESGEIQYPLKETMISGNLAQMFNNIKNISKERVDFGGAIFPWIHFSGLTISGK